MPGLDLRDGLPLLLYPVDRAGYGRLCRLLTLGKSRAGKQDCDLSWGDVVAAAEGVLAILLPDAVDDALVAAPARGFFGPVLPGAGAAPPPGRLGKVSAIFRHGAGGPPNKSGS